jgi:SAM-dependent methyltransferase
VMSSLAQISTTDFSDKRLWEILSACPLCSRSAFRKLLDARDRHYGNPGVFPVMRCEACGVSFLNPMPTLAYLSTAYPQDYYAYTAPSASQTRSPRQKQIRRMIRRALCFTSGWTGDPKFAEPGAMLDIGCGAGLFISEMHDKGWDVHGVELDSQAAARGCQQGLDIFPGTLLDAHFSTATFDYVRSNHSFEHIHNPREVLREIRRIIRPNGQLFLGVPNLAGLMSRVWGTYWWYLGAPVHTFGYTPASLSRLLEEEGFRVERVNYNSTFVGIFGSLQIWINRNNGKSSEEGWIVNSWPLKLLGHWFARITDICHSGDCIEVIARPV